MGWGRTCQFSPASLASACSRSFSRVLTLLHGGWWLVSRAVYGTRGTWDKGQVWRPKQDSPIELSHTSLVLPLCSLENKVQVLILLLELLNRLDGWTVPELCLEIEDGRLELCEGGCLIRGQREGGFKSLPCRSRDPSRGAVYEGCPLWILRSREGYQVRPYRVRAWA